MSEVPLIATIRCTAAIGRAVPIAKIKILLGGAQRSQPDALARSHNVRRNDARGVFATTLKEDVATVIGPGCCKCSVNHGTPMALASKFRMRDDIFEEPVRRPVRNKFGVVISMQVATIWASAANTKTATPS